MSKLPVISGMEAIKAFSKAGWYPHRQVGSHVVLRKEGSKITLTIPKHKELKPGLLRQLIKVSELTVDEFIELLK
nr:type II toxin-antitoxin system HicA family toxin [uncultured Methanolobus sp.]